MRDKPTQNPLTKKEIKESSIIMNNLLTEKKLDVAILSTPGANNTRADLWRKLEKCHGGGISSRDRKTIRHEVQELR